jgi:signal transduction histidine kinase
LTPLNLVLLMASAIFLCEVGVMYLLNSLPPLSHEYEAIIDSTILLTFLTPFYFLLYRPFWLEHKRSEEEIKYLTRKLLDSAEAERKKISHDLHDQCGQTLTAIQFRMNALRKSLPTHHLQQKEDVQEIVGLISLLGNELREVTSQLRPSMLDEIGLLPALKALVADFCKQYPSVSVSEEYRLAGQRNISADMEVAIYRVCQESLSNVIKYANASRVSVILETQAEKIVLRVEDNGVGFDAKNLTDTTRAGKGVGLLGLRERVSGLNGEFELISSPGKGTSITIDLPLREEINES